MKRFVLAPLLALCALPGPLAAAEVALVGLIGSRAILSVDGGPPRTVAVGRSTPEGVLLVSLDGERAVVEAGGRRDTIRLGERAVWRDTSGDALSVTLYADSRGHFISEGSVNGVPIRFLVDTGATMVSLGKGDAERAGIDFRRGQETSAQTAAGRTRAWHVRLNTVRLGAVELRNVDALILEHDLPMALLGMSFLNRTELKHQGNALTLVGR